MSTNTKTYLRYEESDQFGIVASHESCIVIDSKSRWVFSSGVQEVLQWNLRSSELTHRFKAGSERREITCIVLNNEDSLMAVGHASGIVNLWNLDTKELLVSFNGHKTAVTALRFSSDSLKLASGSTDTDIVIWDVVGRTGLFRLKGHKDQITDLHFVGDSNLELFSSSKDTLIKCWDLETQHCVNTFVGHRSAVWGFAFNKMNDRFITIASDNQLRAYLHVDEQVQSSENNSLSVSSSGITVSGDHTAVPRLLGASWKLMSGAVARQSAERAETIMFSRDGKLLGIQCAGKTLEIYRVRTVEEIQKKTKRRLKRIREKKGETAPESGEAHLGDELQLLAVLRTDQKMRSFAFGKSNEHKAQIAVSFITNCIEIYDINIDEHEEDEDGANKKRKRELEVTLNRVGIIELQGHRNDVRALALSSDDTLVLTSASGACKLWNVSLKTCIRTLPCGYSLCCAFVPGDMHALVGTKTGHLMLFNLSSGELMSDIAAHDDAIWSIDIRPDGKGFVTGSADKHVKFWEFDIVREGDKHATSSSESSDSDEDDAADESDNEDPSNGGVTTTSGNGLSGVLDVVHTRTMKLGEDVMCVKYSHHRGTSRLMLAVALIDSTVKLFHEDTLKFSMSLYGHKLPVLSMDISSDNTLIVTASADKNIKVWGLDFGDCHKSFFAHDASVMSVKFVPRTHYFFSGGKDQRIRYWDADKFDMILSLEGHVGEVWGLAVSSDGSFVISSGHDKSLRKWERTNDIVFIEEEREKELEKKFDEKLLQDTDPSKVGTQSIAVVQAITSDSLVESAAAAKRSSESLRAGDRLTEALDVADEAKEKLREYEHNLELEMSRLTEEEKQKLAAAKKMPVPAPTPNVVMLGKSPTEYIVYILKGIKSNELEEALILQPFTYALRLFAYLHEILKDREHYEQDVEVCSKVAIALIRVHFKQLVATQTIRTQLSEMRELMKTRLSGLQDVFGTNIAGLKALRRQLIEMHTSTM